MSKTARKPGKGKSVERGGVKIIAEGGRRVTLIFPKPSKAAGTKGLSASAVMKLVKGGCKGEVAGQCQQDCFVQCNYCKSECSVCHSVKVWGNCN